MLGDETEILHHHACQHQKCQSKGALPEYTVCNFNLYPVIAGKKRSHLHVTKECIACSLHSLQLLQDKN